MDSTEQAISIVTTLLSSYNGMVGRELLNENIDFILNNGTLPSDQVDRERVLKVLECKFAIFSEAHTILQEGYTPWLLDKKAEIEWNFWKRYKAYLLMEKGFAPDTVNQLDSLTDDILDRIGNPKGKGAWDKRGMVVGQVQSGKTSNYSGLICKAIDAGYRFIVVLAGIHNSLRAQTQLRMDEAIIGFDTKIERNFNRANNWIGVGLSGVQLPVHSLTTSVLNGDFNKPAVLRSGITIRSTDPIILVVKKNTSILRNLLNWLSAHGDMSEKGYNIIRDVPLLLVDDEADNASINIGKDDISKTNLYIRALLNLFERRSYIGYTATPFANIFIPHLEKEKEDEIVRHIGELKCYIGQDLFPRDFIINIKPPSNYIGPAKVFGIDPNVWQHNDDEDLSEDMARNINDYHGFVPNRHKKDDPLPEDIPESLQKAIKCFILTCAIRRTRGQIKKHNSMLVHISLFVRWIDKIASIIDAYLRSYKNQIEYQEGALLEELYEIWINEYIPTSRRMISKIGDTDPGLTLHSWNEIKESLFPAVSKIEVRAVHGTRKTAELNHKNITPLDYYEHAQRGLSVIAVGGNKLSRGLTLEGLSVSYYLRATRMYDTLMQMGRWFGYRPGYVDLCRLFTSSELIEWYQHITVAAEEVRAEFDNMFYEKRRPKEYGLKVRTHPGVLQITSASKFRSHEKISLSYSGRLRETYEFTTSPGTHRHNLNVFKKLLSDCGEGTLSSSGFVWLEVDSSHIVTFLENYHTSQRTIAPERISSYVEKQATRGWLKDWTVVLISSQTPENKYKLEVNDRTVEVGMTIRNNTVRDSDVYYLSKSHIIDPKHESLDFDKETEHYIQALEATNLRRKKEAELKGNNYKPVNIPAGNFIRERRDSTRGLLLLYLLDPKGYPSSMRDAGVEVVVGYAISFPHIENDQKVEYAVNLQFLNEEFGYEEEEEEEEYE